MGKAYRLISSAAAASRKAKRTAVKNQLTALDDANVKPNLSGPEQTALLRELSLAVERIIRDQIGG